MVCQVSITFITPIPIMQVEMALAKGKTSNRNNRCDAALVVDDLEVEMMVFP